MELVFIPDHFEVWIADFLQVIQVDVLKVVQWFFKIGLIRFLSGLSRHSVCQKLEGFFRVKSEFVCINYSDRFGFANLLGWIFCQKEYFLVVFQEKFVLIIQEKGTVAFINMGKPVEQRQNRFSAVSNQEKILWVFISLIKLRDYPWNPLVIIESAQERIKIWLVDANEEGFCERADQAGAFHDFFNHNILHYGRFTTNNDNFALLDKCPISLIVAFHHP